jgi:hypothetical protein
MDKYPLYLDGRAAGELTETDSGMYADYRAVCRSPGPALLRAYLAGERSEMLLGVLAPEGGLYTIRRRLSHRETANLGKLIRCEARRNGEQAWERVPVPERLLSTPFFSHMLRGLSGVLSRKRGERRLVAIPYDPAKPFPMTPLFCFAKICQIEGFKYAVFAFDPQEIPRMP